MCIILEGFDNKMVKCCNHYLIYCLHLLYQLLIRDCPKVFNLGLNFGKTSKNNSEAAIFCFEYQKLSPIHVHIYACFYFFYAIVSVDV